MVRAAIDTSATTTSRVKKRLAYILISFDRMNLRCASAGVLPAEVAHRSFDDINVARDHLPGLPFFTKIIQMNGRYAILPTERRASCRFERDCLWPPRFLPAHWKNSPILVICCVTCAVLRD